MRQVMEIETSVAANSTEDNVLNGQRFERAPFDGFMKIYSTGSAAGLREEINVGGRSISPRMIVNAQNRSPVVPDDLRIDEVPVYTGELIQISATNTTAGALTYRLRVELDQGQWQ